MAVFISRFFFHIYKFYFNLNHYQIALFTSTWIVLISFFYVSLDCTDNIFYSIYIILIYYFILSILIRDFTSACNLTATCSILIAVFASVNIILIAVFKLFLSFVKHISLLRILLQVEIVKTELHILMKIKLF